MGRTYAFLFTVVTSQNGQAVGNNTLAFVVKVNSEPVFASILGGTERQVPVIAGKVYIAEFDASPSSDPMNETAVLGFEWRVVRSDGEPAPQDSLISSPNAAKLSLNSSRLTSDAVYTVYVTVTGEPLPGTPRQANASQEVVTTSFEIPLVKIEKPRGTQAYSQAAGKWKFNTGRKIILTASVENYNLTDVQFRWLCASGNANLSAPGIVSSRQGSPNLVISAGGLAPGGIYKFKAEVKNIQTQQIGYALVSFETNDIPSTGVCESTPSAGYALDTTFRLSCTGWTDVDVPLKYVFETVSGDGSSDATPISGLRTLSYYDTLLPEPRETGQNLTVNARILDAIGAEVSYKFGIMVTGRPLDVSAVQNQISTRLSEGDTQTFSVLVTGTAAYIRGSSSTSSRGGATEAASVVNGLLNSLETLVGNNQGASAEDRVKVPMSLMNSVTSYPNPDELTPESRNKAIDLIGAVTNDSMNTFSADVVGTSFGALSNVIGATEGGSSVSDEEKRNTSGKIEGIFATLSRGMLSEAVVGENAIEVNKGGIAMSSKLASAEEIGGQTVASTSTTAGMDLPSDFSTSISSSSPIEITLTYVDKPMYPTGDGQNTGLLVASLGQG
mmetsp:Transcript_8346/g.20497  ORF Transcript_8346/g.20497 Transcript_8346/m.20497 type:complete len:614 (+) Transcript_8346:1212-3053(+)